MGNFRVIHSQIPSILPVTDLLIGDMSDINYEFLLFDKPVVLLANKWLERNFPEVGVFVADPLRIEATVLSALTQDTYTHKRASVRELAIEPGNSSHSRRCLDLILSRAGMSKPIFHLIDGGNIIHHSNLKPLADCAKTCGHTVVWNTTPTGRDVIHIAAHFGLLRGRNVSSGYRVHFDHGPKGDGTSQLVLAVNDYKRNNFFPEINLHVTAGKMGYTRTSMLLGSNWNRVASGGYPKADLLLSNAQSESAFTLFDMLKLDRRFPVVTYAPAGALAFDKPGGSMSPLVIRALKALAKSQNLNVVIKMKYPFMRARTVMSSARKALRNSRIFGWQQNSSIAGG